MFNKLLMIGAMVAACLGINVPASGVLIYEMNYDSPTSSPSYNQADPGGTANLVVGTTGVGSMNAAHIDFDLTSSSPFSINYFANFSFAPVAAPTSANPADYEFSFEVQADGLIASAAGGKAQIALGDVTFQGDYDATGTYSTITFNLADMDQSGGTFELSDINAGGQFRADSRSVVGNFGSDAGNALHFDNWRLTEIATVPEASSFVALSLLGIGFMARTDRRNRAC